MTSQKNHEPIDLFNDPLLPEDDGHKPRRGSEKKKNKLGGSFGEGDRWNDFEDDEEDIAFEDLDENEKYQVLQHLYEEYQKDPDNFPEDQRLILEQELKELFEQNEGEEGEDSSDERMKIQGNINFPKQGLPTRKGDEDESAPHINQDDDEEEDDDQYI